MKRKTIVFETDEALAITRACRKRGMSFSAFVREACAEKVKVASLQDVSRDIKDQLDEINRVISEHRHHMTSAMKTSNAELAKELNIGLAGELDDHKDAMKALVARMLSGALVPLPQAKRSGMDLPPVVKQRTTS